MGCDIHMVVEVKHGEKWVGLHAFPYLHAECYARGKQLFDAQGAEVTVIEGMTHHIVRSRNYEFFAALAGVRGDGPKAKGTPKDASDLARMEIEAWGEDGHSHSYCSLKKFIEAGIKTEQLPDPVRKKVEEGAASYQIDPMHEI